MCVCIYTHIHNKYIYMNIPRPKKKRPYPRFRGVSCCSNFEKRNG